MTPETLTGLLSRVAERTPGAPAIVHDGREMSFGELVRRSQQVAGGLVECGIGPGDRVALWLPNLPAYLILCFALWRLGAVAVAVNTRFRSAEVQDILRRSRARVLAMWSDFKDIDFVGMLGEIDPAALDTLEKVLVYDTEDAGSQHSILGREVVTFAALEATAPYERDHATPDSPCAMFTTSGTTRAPKLVLHRQHAVARHAGEVASVFGFDADDAVTLQALPLCGVYGFTQALAALAGGRPQVVLPVYEAEAAAAAVQQYRVTHMMGTDDMFDRMLAVRSEERPFPSLRRCGFASFNPTLTDFVRTCERRGVPLVGLYGMSEVLALYSLWPPDQPAERRRQGGGFPVSDAAEVRVCDPETGELVQLGETGELQFKGPSLMLGYDGNPEATAAAFTAEGFLRSGDLGYLTDDGGFVFLSRMGDVLRLAGFLVSPSEIEAYIEQHPDVEGVQVIGVATARGPRALAFVVPRAGTTVDEAALADHCRRGLANYKAPVRFVAIDAFPVTPSANGFKIQRNKLRDMAQAIIESAEAVAS